MPSRRRPRRKPEVEPYRPRPGSHLVAVLPDIHIPRHDRLALACVLAVVDLMRPQGLLQLGDAMDCEPWSAHPRAARAEEVAEDFYESEIAPMRAFLAWCERSVDWTVMLEGNHEFRVERALLKLGDMGRSIASMVSPRRLLTEGRAKPFTWVDYVQRPGASLPHYRLADDLVAVHGWSYCRHVAAKHLDLARNFSVVFGHVHRRQHFTVRQPITNTILEGWSPGCLAQLQPIYMAHTPTDAVHGFDLVWISDDKRRWTHYSVLIREGVCVLPDGRKVDGRDYLPTLARIEAGEGA